MPISKSNIGLDVNGVAVNGDSVESRTLLVCEGGEISIDTAEKYGLLVDGKEVSLPVVLAKEEPKKSK